MIPVIKSDESDDVDEFSGAQEFSGKISDEFYVEIRRRWRAQTNKTIYATNPNKSDRIIDGDRHLFV
ncbi:hypothetical protein Bca101_060111 [Brassica carinata]